MMMIMTTNSGITRADHQRDVIIRDSTAQVLQVLSVKLRTATSNGCKTHEVKKSKA
jgi:hypothetical protein